ncbi:biliverdin-producing heme oxygenase [Nigerium massiliense]|uniref:biliverdin-producing heme oxygenase n=1 Tax=Nigerium massiliense TaxID=1522317 RepID=UPI000BE7F92A|nr:biliverdin-producing heme oxygenase [Nigerium massiliense]
MSNDAPLSEALRTATDRAHKRAEHSPFMADLLEGRASVAAFVALTGQLLHVYRALEAAVRSHAQAPELAPIADPGLERVARLESDLRELGVDPATVEALPATAAYVARIEAADAPALVAHHYVRYLGDLSGGQVIATMLGRHYGLTEGVSFYDFGDLGRPKPYKDAYRAKLDALPVGDALDRVLAEAVAAFGANEAVFADLTDQRFQ